MSNIKTLPLQENATDEQVLLRMLERVRSGKATHIFVLYKNETESVCHCTSHVRSSQISWMLQLANHNLITDALRDQP